MAFRVARKFRTGGGLGAQRCLNSSTRPTRAICEGFVQRKTRWLGKPSDDRGKVLGNSTVVSRPPQLLMINILNKLLLLSTALASLTSATVAHADLGWTLEQCRQKYGVPTFGPGQAHKETFYVWDRTDGFYAVFLPSGGTVNSVVYGFYKPMDDADLSSIFKETAPRATWEPLAYPNSPIGHTYWVGRENGIARMIADCFAVIRDNGTNSWCVNVETPEIAVWMNENP